jgi:hypothetical protein
MRKNFINFVVFVNLLIVADVFALPKKKSKPQTIKLEEQYAVFYNDCVNALLSNYKDGDEKVNNIYGYCADHYPAIASKMKQTRNSINASKKKTQKISRKELRRNEARRIRRRRAYEEQLLNEFPDAN